MMQSIRRAVTVGQQNPNIWTRGIRSISTTTDDVAALIDSLSLKPGRALVHNCGDSEIGKMVIQLAKERIIETITIIDDIDKPGTPEIIQEFKALAADLVVPESYTKTCYFLSAI